MAYDPNWTADEAISAFKAAAADPTRRPDAWKAMLQWSVHQELLRLEQEYLAGDRRALMWAISFCAKHDMVLPAWVSRAYIKAHDRVRSGEIGSWDDAFGRPYPKGAHLARLRKWHRHSQAVWSMVQRARASDSGLPAQQWDLVHLMQWIRARDGADAALPSTAPKSRRESKTLYDDYFPAVAKEFGLNETETREMFYEEDRAIRELLYPESFKNSRIET